MASLEDDIRKPEEVPAVSTASHSWSRSPLEEEVRAALHEEARPVILARLYVTLWLAIVGNVFYLLIDVQNPQAAAWPLVLWKIAAIAVYLGALVAAPTLSISGWTGTVAAAMAFTLFYAIDITARGIFVHDPAPLHACSPLSSWAQPRSCIGGLVRSCCSPRT